MKNISLPFQHYFVVYVKSLEPNNVSTDYLFFEIASTCDGAIATNSEATRKSTTVFTKRAAWG